MRDAFDFYFNIFRKAGDFYGCSGGFVVTKAFGVDFIHPDKIVHVFEKDRGFDDLVQSAAAGFENLGEVFELGVNLGCVGGLTFEEFTKLSDEEKKKIEHERPRWCKVEYEKTVGWVAGRYLTEGYCEQPADEDSE